MQAELVQLRCSLLLALGLSERRKTYDERETALTAQLRDAMDCLAALEERHASLLDEVPPEVSQIKWHLSIPDGAPFERTMAHILATSLRSLPWPPGVIVRWHPAREEGYPNAHQFVVHHESQDVGSYLRVVSKNDDPDQSEYALGFAGYALGFADGQQYLRDAIEVEAAEDPEEHYLRLLEELDQHWHKMTEKQQEQIEGKIRNQAHPDDGGH